MDVQDQIVEFLKTTGPTLPSKVSKNIKTEILIASAYLSDLASQGKVRISHLKVGGSPLYYLPGQEAQLYPFAAGNINSKDLIVLERLKDEKVLQEENLDLLSKVGLRSLRDFATPLHVNLNGKKQLFWKWHSLPQEETNKIIADLLQGNEQLNHLLKNRSETVVTSDITPPLMQKKVEVSQKEAEREIDSKEQKLVLLQKEEVYPEKEELQQKLDLPKKVEEVVEKKEEVKEVVKKVETEEEVKLKLEEKKPVIKKVKVKKRIIPDTFSPEIKELFVKLEIKVNRQEMVRKNAEMNFFVDVPSVVGAMHYFCKAKNKNKCDEKDLSAAYVEAQMKKLPLLFLYTNQISKKAQKMLESGAFENIVIKKIE